MGAMSVFCKAGVAAMSVEWNIPTLAIFPIYR
jgi:hypothetical protein